jgi:hippurate hydrolase
MSGEPRQRRTRPADTHVGGVLPEIAARADAAIAIRHDLHRHPELAFEHRTSARVAELLQQWGYEVTTGIGGTGVVGTLQRGQGSRRLGLRADIDALPIHEDSGLAYASQTDGLMHACGHDGHTAILLSAAHCWPPRPIDGTLQLVFQPAEETGSGASKMIADGLFERFPVDAIYGLHNWPGVPVGHFGFVDGPAMASVDWARLKVIGKGGHGAEPQGSVDPILVAAHHHRAAERGVAQCRSAADGRGHRRFDPWRAGRQCDSGRGRAEADRARLPARGARHAAPPVIEIAEQTAAAFGARAEIDSRVASQRDQPPAADRLYPRRGQQGFGAEQVVPASRRARPARTSPSCCRHGPAVSCSSATATAHRCTARAMCSTTPPSHPPPACGRGWPKTIW